MKNVRLIVDKVGESIIGVVEIYVNDVFVWYLVDIFDWFYENFKIWFEIFN